MTSAWSIKLMIPISPAHGGLPGMDFYNIKRDPGEKYKGTKASPVTFPIPLTPSN